MGEKITDEQVDNLQAFLRTDASVDAKIAEITVIKSGIKQNNVPTASAPVLFESLRLVMDSQQSALVNAGLTTLTYVLTRLAKQEPKLAMREAARTVPLLVEKIGDPKDKFRALAAQCLTTLWSMAPMDVERGVKNNGMVGKNGRSKEACMHWLVQMHNDYGLQFKGFVPVLMELLEDADGMVRDVAKETVIVLFQHAPNTAKSDLKRQLKIFNVRPTIADPISNALVNGSSVEADMLPQEPRVAAPKQFASSVSSQISTARPVTPAIEEKLERVDPAYVNTQRELEDAFKDMYPFFEGKESEQNWLKREQSCTRLRKLNAGNSPTDFREVWLLNLKGLLDGILKAVNSLRTSLSKEGCHAVQEITRTAGPGMDPMVEILLQNLIKLCGGTKKIASQAGDDTVDVIVSNVSYNIRILQHIWLACQDKNVQPRTYAAGWLLNLIKKESHHKSHVEHGGGLEIIEKCIKKGLSDANPGVREKMRKTYWTFSQIWPGKATAIMATLDATHARLLENDPSNPHSPKKPEVVVARPGMGFSKSTTGPPRQSVRDHIMAQKKATTVVKSIPVRPGSAMSTFSPARSISTTSTASISTGRSDAPTARPRPETKVSHGGLSVAPMRPAKSRPRPELTRPATAGPYSVRPAGHGPSSSVESASISPVNNARIKVGTSSATNSPPKKMIARPSTSHSSHSSQSSHVSPSKEKPPVSRIPTSPRSPLSKSSMSNVRMSSPAKNDEDLTMVIPNVSAFNVSQTEKNAALPPVSSPLPTVTPAKSLKVFEDPFSSTDDQTTPRPMFTAPVLEEVPVNEDAANLARVGLDDDSAYKAANVSPERSKQNYRLLDSGITRVKAKSLDVHGFRKLQGLIRENKTTLDDDRFDALLSGLFEYLQAQLPALTPEKVQDVKAQILATIKLIFKKDREAFRPYVARGIRSLLATRSSYDGRAHIVSGLEILADELVTLANPQETTETVIDLLEAENMSLEGCRTFSMGLYVLKELLDASMSFAPSDAELDRMGALALRCLDSSDSRVRMDAVQVCVSMHAKVGEEKFWGRIGGIKDDPKSLITYYIVKRQKETAAI